MSSKCTAAKAYDILGIYDFPDNFDALNGLHSYLYTNSDMVVEALASQKYDLARDIVTAIETVDKDGSYDDCAFYVSRDGIRILRTAEELIDALGECEVETNMVLSVYSRQNFIRYFALLRDMDAFVFVSGRKIEALEDLSGLPLAENCSGLDIDRILQRPKCLG